MLNLKNSIEGKKLIELSRQTTMNFIERISREYKTVSHVELITLCADMKANLDLFKLFSGIEQDIEAIRMLFEEEIKDDN